MHRLVLAVTSTAALVLGAAGPATAVAPAVACGDTITGSVTLTSDLTCTDVGLVLAPGATVDLGGHSLRGPGTSAGIAFRTDPDLSSTGHVAVRNGTVRDWAHVLGDGDTGELHASLTDVTVQDADSAVTSMYADVSIVRSRLVRTGSFVWGGPVVVQDSTLVDSHLGVGPSLPDLAVSGSTFRRSAIDGSCTDGGRIRVGDSHFVGGRQAISSGWCGLDVTGSSFRGIGTAIVTSKDAALGSNPSTLTGNAFTGNGTALELGSQTTVRDSVFSRNAIGIHSETAEWGEFAVEDIVLDRNTFSRNGDGVVIDTLAHVGRNRATHNTGYGLFVPEAVDLGRNVAYGNGVDCVGVVCRPRS